MNIGEFEDYLELQDPKVQAQIQKSHRAYVAGKSRPAEMLLTTVPAPSGSRSSKASPLASRVNFLLMISRTELKKLARSRLQDAEVLFNSRRYDGPVYLCGYAVELALKARICRTLKRRGRRGIRAGE